MTCVSASTYVNKTEIRTSSGLYYDRTGSVSFIEGKWDIVTFIDIGIYKERLELVNRVYKSTYELCNRGIYKELGLCEPSLQLLGELVDSLNRNCETLDDFVVHDNRRRKRAYLDIIGEAFKTLFGTLDSNDGIYYNKMIDKVYKDEREFTTLLKQQTQIVETAVINFNTTINKLNVNEDIFNNNFKKLQAFSKDIERHVFDIEIKQDVEKHLSLLTLLVTELETEFHSIINTVLFARKNIIHPFVMTPKQFMQELIRSMPYLPSSLSYPLPIVLNNVNKFLELVDIQVYNVKNRIIFRISNVLCTINNFNLFELISLPMKRQDNNYVFILPRIKYIAISESKAQYVSINDLNDCKKLDSDKNLCLLNDAIYTTHNRELCEVQLITQNNHNIPKSCDVRIVQRVDEIWHKTANGWIYVFPEGTTITFKCNNSSPFDLTVQGTGILNIHPSCKVYSASSIITNKENVKNPFDVSSYVIVPDFNILEDECCKLKNKTVINKVEIPMLYPRIKTLNSEDLEIASHKLNDIYNKLDERENNKETIVNKIVNNNYFSYIIMSILKVLFLYLAYKLYKYLKNKYSQRNKEVDCKVLNCVTFNICKDKTTVYSDNTQHIFNTDEQIEDSIQLEAPKLRRSTRNKLNIA